MKTNSKWVLWVIMALLVGMFLLALPVGAQETAGQAGTTVGAGQQAAQSPDIFSLTIGELIGIVLGLGALGVAVGKILWDGNQPGQPTVDQRLTARVDVAHSDREWIERLERAYMLGGSNTQRLVDAFTGVLTNVSPLTGVKVDDALLRLLKDVQQPGQPTEEVIDPLAPKTSAG